MAELLDDSQLARLLAEPKYLPRNWQLRLRLKPQPDLSQRRATLAVTAESGEFRLSIRQSTINHSDFSVILGYRQPERWFRIRRHNGLHPPEGSHRNKLEAERIKGFHIHIATLRYQVAGFEEDAFAIPTNRFRDLQSALECMIEDGSFMPPNPEPGESMDLFSHSKK
jgi:hypothetical protein